MAAAAGMPDWLIKVLGYWSSDCHQLYNIIICTPKSVLHSVAPKMASVTDQFFAHVNLALCVFVLGGCSALYVSGG